MSYGPEGVSRDFTRIRQGRATFNQRARLEHHMVTVLMEQGDAAVAALLESLAGHDFRRVQVDSSEKGVRYASAGDGPRRLVVDTFLDPHSASVNVTVEDPLAESPDDDPRHQAFYDTWESLLGLPDSEVADLDPKQKAVFLVALLEAEVMNGGFGQYLANTEGAHLEDTLDCLARIGAEETRTLLIEAGRLAATADSYVEAWDTRSGDFQRLDEKFLDSDEDLALLTHGEFF